MLQLGALEKKYIILPAFFSKILYFLKEAVIVNIKHIMSKL